MSLSQMAAGVASWLASGAGDPGRPWALLPMDEAVLPLVAEVEKTAYAHPWGERHFRDSIASGYWAQMLVTEPQPDDPPAWIQAPCLPDGRLLLGYLVAMRGVGETHLLNITTVPMHQRQGCARLLLGALTAWSRLQGAEWLWLEVRAGNLAARALYESLGFQQVGLRRGYYPDQGARREDAVVMSLALAPAPAAGAQR
ncbi:MAG: hypothetical protein RJA36_2080 [Pseudomonadota bacterium]|jgi:ribosomal-protein-alanine N-acetyltransferase